MQVYDSKINWQRALADDPLGVLSENLGIRSFDPILTEILLQEDRGRNTYFLYCAGRCVKGFAIVMNKEKSIVAMQFAANPVYAKIFMMRLQKYILQSHNKEKSLEINILAPNPGIAQLLIEDFDYRPDEKGNIVKIIMPLLITPQFVRRLFGQQQQLQQQGG